MKQTSSHIAIAGYSNFKLLSSAKFGKVWSATEEVSQKSVVVKEIPSDTEKSDIINQLGSIVHPALLNRYKTIHFEGKTYLVRAFVAGRTIKEILVNPRIYRKIDTRFWMDGFIQLASGLECLHQYGVLHCDIKPSNILVVYADGEDSRMFKPKHIRLIDFELCRKYPSISEGSRTPFAMGYSPPEQMLNYGELLCPASDLFALGVTLYEVLTHKKAFHYFDPEMLLHLQLNSPLRKPFGMRQEIFRIIEKATARQPFRLPPRLLNHDEIISNIQAGIQLRFSSASQFAEALGVEANYCRNARTNLVEKLFKFLK
ncbi:serine/threonine protein kinase [Alkaliflexus imshenetskii]|uniref:serine/threonine protein kinase n=1 Tax=Alkaliflexus imshenetskii TaxID=286730 RepID=UPI000479F7B6|nr:protein kinase [Alkaliflexus imshenetskii]